MSGFKRQSRGVARARSGWLRAGGLAVVGLVLAAACAWGGPSGPSATNRAAGDASSGAAPAPAGGNVPARDVTVAIPAQSLTTFPLVLGQEDGIFQRHGINLNVVTMAGNAAIAGVISGSVDYATPAGSLIRAINTGAPLRIVVGLSDKSNHLFVVNPAVIREGKDLEGKTIAVNDVGGNTHLEAQAVLQRFGVDKDRANYIAIVDNSQRLAAVQAGAAHATISNVPFNFAAEKMGLVIFANLADFYELPTGVLATSEQNIVANPELVQRMVTATLEALRYVRSQRAAAVQAIVRQYDMPEGEAAIAYDLSRDTWSATGRLSETAYTNAMDPAELGSALPMNRVVDPQFVEAAR